MAPVRKSLQSEREPSRKSGRLQAAKALKESIKAEGSKITKPKRFRRPKQRKSCKILQLPGEIRNLIYRAAIVDEDQIIVSAYGPGEPALLKTCRQIRTETRKIYYSENKFYLVIQDYNGKALTHFARQHWRATPDSGTYLMRMAGVPNWTNLLEWLKEICHGSCLVPEFDESDSECEDCGGYHRENAIKGMFKIALTLQYRLPCSTIETVLEAAHQALRAADSRWK